MEVIDFAKEQLLNDISKLENNIETGKLNKERFKLKLAGILADYDVKKEVKHIFETDIQR